MEKSNQVLLLLRLKGSKIIFLFERFSSKVIGWVKAVDGVDLEIWPGKTLGW